MISNDDDNRAYFLRNLFNADDKKKIHFTRAAIVPLATLTQTAAWVKHTNTYLCIER